MNEFAGQQIIRYPMQLYNACVFDEFISFRRWVGASVWVLRPSPYAGMPVQREFRIMCLLVLVFSLRSNLFIYFWIVCCFSLFWIFKFIWSMVIDFKCEMMTNKRRGGGGWGDDKVRLHSYAYQELHDKCHPNVWMESNERTRI